MRTKGVVWLLAVLVAPGACRNDRTADGSDPDDATMVAAALTQPTSCAAPVAPPGGVVGGVLYEKWVDVPGKRVSDVPVTRDADFVEERSAFDAPRDIRDNYGARLSGWVTPPETGAYTFWVAGDDAANLYLSTDITRENKTRIAYHEDFADYKQWNKFATQKSTAITLQKGKWYYIEGLMKEASGRDHLSVGWLKPGQTGSQPSEIIPGSQLAPFREVTVPPPIGRAGSILYEKWLDVAGRAVENIPTTTTPNVSEERPSFDGLKNIRDSYAARMRGWISPPVTGSYTFWISGDDNVALYLSTDATAAKKVRIAYHTDFTDYLQWTKFATQKSAALPLEKGKWYYIEALAKEHSGGDHVSVGWLKPGQTGTRPSQIIPGVYLAPFRVPGGEHPYVRQLANGDVRFSVTLPANNAHVELFAQKNGGQNLARNIVASGKPNADGTVTYSHVVPASGYQDGDRVVARFHSYRSGQPAVFTPGPTDGVWSPIYVVRKLLRNVCVSKPDVCAGESVRVSADAQDSASPLRAPSVLINSAPAAGLWDQFMGNKGPRLVAVSATSADGVVASTIVSVNVTECGQPDSARPPKLMAEPDPYDQDLVNFTVGNAGHFAGGAPTYVWTFGDGTTASTQAGAVSHKYDWTDALDQPQRAFDVSVTVVRAGAASVAATRTFVVWNDYAIGKTRGVLEPPARAVAPALLDGGSNYTGGVLLRNLEPTALVYDRLRVDQISCDANAGAVAGSQVATSITVPARGQLLHPIVVDRAGLRSDTCAVNVHLWGAVGQTPAQVSIQLDRPAQLGAGTPVNAATNQLLQYVVDNGLVAHPTLVSDEELFRLYRDNRLPKTSVALSLGGAGAAAAERCDPDNPGSPPRVGYSCQPTGEWENESNGGPSGAQIANAMKGDTVIIRGCAGFIGTMMGKVNPPQWFTHSGIMTQNRFEIAHSTGEVSYLMNHPNGVAGQPTDGFEEDALRYLWPGSLTSTVEEAFDTGRAVSTPEGETERIKGFTASEARCQGDANIVYPRVLKPAPALDAMARAKLHAAADAAKNIRSHYRFATYSSALATIANDPNGPDPVPAADGRSPTFGQVPSVCSQFVRFALQAGGFTLDQDKTFPTASDVRRGPADGLFFYDASERRAAADALYTSLYNTVQRELEAMEASADDYWWAGSPLLAFGPVGVAAAGLIAFGLDSSGDLIRWTTDAPDDVANQIVNCFASDYCSEDAKDSEAWKEPGTGFAVSPDDILNYYDSPATGGPYGYHERLVYRGKRYRPIFTWQPAEGTRLVAGTVVDEAGAPVEAATVELKGLDLTAATDAAGRFSFDGVPGGNLMVHAQKRIGDDQTGFLQEGDSCYVAHPADAAQLLNVSCQDFTTPVSNDPQAEVRVVLGGRDPRFRDVLITGSIRMEDCDCCAFEVCSDRENHTIHVTCVVSPLEPTRPFSIGKDQLCVDEVGLAISGTCTLLPNQRTVHVEGKATMYEAGEGSCGGNEEESSETFAMDIPAETTQNIYMPVVSNGGVCTSPIGLPFDCDDRADFDNFRAQNRLAQ